jgi:hypothetical protein
MACLRKKIHKNGLEFFCCNKPKKCFFGKYCIAETKPESSIKKQNIKDKHNRRLNKACFAFQQFIYINLVSIRVHGIV